MATCVVVGTQWGDEGKGKITDLFAEQADVVARYQGGANAGHTVVIGDRKYKLHLVPSGILSENKLAVIGNGVVVDPVKLYEELQYLQQAGVDISRLRISSRAHVIMPYHRLLDRLEEESRGDSKIGTTGRGIGPAYVDKAARTGIRMIDLLDRNVLVDKLSKILPAKNRMIERVYGYSPITVEEILVELEPAVQAVKQYVTDTSELLMDAINAGKNILFEGAQGTLLDVDFGTYPFVTSSNPTAGAAAVGTGIGPRYINKVVGVAKAYSTRVGEGPFPSELVNEIGDIIRERGHEYGTTTGRPRRCGWLDAVILRYAARINGMDGIALNCLDVLDTLDEIKICVAYECDGRRLETFPADLATLARCQPVYETLPGWKTDLTGARTLEDLPEQAKAYAFRVAELADTRLVSISVGPKRDQTIVLEPPFAKK